MINGESMSYARVNTTIVLRGHRFPSGTMIRVWKTSGVTSIQPISHEGPLWYSLPDVHRKHIIPLEVFECDMVDFGIL